MEDMTEQVIATDLFISAKAGVTNYAKAISETATSEVRETLRRHLDNAIDTYERIAAYMLKKGYYQAYNPHEQLKVDIQAANTVSNIKY